MVRRPRWTRDEAIHYLKNNLNFQDLRRAQPRARDLGDNSTAQLKRYAAGMWQAELEGRKVKHLGELRGHTATEHKPNRPPKKGYEAWQPPETIQRGLFILPRSHPGAASAIVCVTSGESVAVRFLAKMAKTIRTQHGEKVEYHSKRLGKDVPEPSLVSLHVQGYRVGEASDLFTKGGWEPEALLLAAGYKRGDRGRWYKPAGAEGLERYLVRYVRANSKSPGATHEWPGIRLYQIFGWGAPEKDARGMAEREGRQALSRVFGRER